MKLYDVKTGQTVSLVDAGGVQKEVVVTNVARVGPKLAVWTCVGDFEVLMAREATRGVHSRVEAFEKGVDHPWVVTGTVG